MPSRSKRRRNRPAPSIPGKFTFSQPVLDRNTGNELTHPRESDDGLMWKPLPSHLIPELRPGYVIVMTDQGPDVWPQDSYDRLGRPARVDVLAAKTGIVNPNGMTLGEAIGKSPAYRDFAERHGLLSPDGS